MNDVSNEEVLNQIRSKAGPYTPSVCSYCDNSGWVAQQVVCSKAADGDEARGVALNNKIPTYREEIGPCHACNAKLWREWANKVADRLESKAA